MHFVYYKKGEIPVLYIPTIQDLNEILNPKKEQLKKEQLEKEQLKKEQLKKEQPKSNLVYKIIGENCEYTDTDDQEKNEKKKIRKKEPRGFKILRDTPRRNKYHKFNKAQRKFLYKQFLKDKYPTDMKYLQDMLRMKSNSWQVPLTYKVIKTYFKNQRFLKKKDF